MGDGRGRDGTVTSGRDGWFALVVAGLMGVALFFALGGMFMAMHWFGQRPNTVKTLPRWVVPEQGLQRSWGDRIGAAEHQVVLHPSLFVNDVLEEERVDWVQGKRELEAEVRRGDADMYILGRDGSGGTRDEVVVRMASSGSRLVDLGLHVAAPRVMFRGGWYAVSVCGVLGDWEVCDDEALDRIVDRVRNAVPAPFAGFRWRARDGDSNDKKETFFDRGVVFWFPQDSTQASQSVTFAARMDGLAYVVKWASHPWGATPKHLDERQTSSLLLSALPTTGSLGAIQTNVRLVPIVNDHVRGQPDAKPDAPVDYVDAKGHRVVHHRKPQDEL